MRLVCEICGKEFEYPYEQINHRHEDIELDLVPPNFWIVKDYFDRFGIKFSNTGEIILPELEYKTKLKSGNTPITRYLDNVYLKDESVNPTGSFKDRGMDNLMNEVLLHGKKKICVVSCGSGAISVIRYAKEYGIKSLVFVNTGIPEESKALIKDADETYYSDTFIKSYEDYMKFALENKETFWGFLNTNVSYMLGLRSLGYEIIKDMEEVPDVVIIPCGSGADIVAQNLAFREMYQKGEINKIPKIVVVEIKGGNPIRTGFEKSHDDYLYIIDEPSDSKTILSNDTCFNYKKIYDMASRDEAFFISVEDRQIDDFIISHPEFESKYDYTSLSAMAAVEECRKKNPRQTIVVVLTCKNRIGGNYE